MKLFFDSRIVLFVLSFSFASLVLAEGNSGRGIHIEVHGHRGTRGTRPENTMPAFKEGVRVGVDFLELDLHFTKDDVLVISHDPTLPKTKCLGPDGRPLAQDIRIRELTYAQLEKYDCGSVPQKDFPEQVLVPHTPHPAFETLLKWVNAHAPNVGLNIETKMDEAPELLPDPKEFAQRVIDMLRRYHRLDKDLLQSFDFRTLTAAKAIEPRLRRVCLTENVADFCDVTFKEDAQFASPDFASVTPAQVSLCHAHGIEIVPWTVDEPKDWENQVKLGVDGIISDYPQKVIAYLKSIGRW